MDALLQELAKSNKVFVAGSFSRGEQTPESDIDFQIKTPKECVLYGGRNPNMVWLIELLDKHGIKWNSTRSGYISTIGENNGLEREIEFYDDFCRNKKKLP